MQLFDDEDIFDIDNENIFENTMVMEGFLVKSAVTNATGGIAHAVRMIDASRVGPLTNDELHELKEAARWCRAEFKKSAPSIIEDRLNKGIIKLGKNDKITKANEDMFDFSASMSDSEIREERWAPVVTVKNELSTSFSDLVQNIGYDFYREVHNELEKRYPNCELVSASVGRYIYILKYKSPKIAKESVAMEAATSSVPLTDRQLKEFISIINKCQDNYPRIRDDIIPEKVKSGKGHDMLLDALSKRFTLNHNIDYDEIKKTRIYRLLSFTPKWGDAEAGYYPNLVASKINSFCMNNNFDVRAGVSIDKASGFRKGDTHVILRYTGELDDTDDIIREKYNQLYPKCKAIISKYVSRAKSEGHGMLDIDTTMPPLFKGEVPKNRNISTDNHGNIYFQLLSIDLTDDADDNIDDAIKIVDKYVDKISDELDVVIRELKISNVDVEINGTDGCTYIELEFSNTKPKAQNAKESAIGGNEVMNELFEGLFESTGDIYEPAFESISTNLRRDYQEDAEEPISLKSMYCVYMNNDALAKYEEEYDQLKKVDKNAEKLRGCMYFWQKELAAFISIDIRSDKVWIDTLEVVKKFRGKKLSFQLLDVAVRKFHATDLRVHIDNKKAISIFKTYGFKTYDKKNKWLYMTLRDDVKDIDDIHTEDVKPVDKGTKTDDIQEAKESAAMEGATARKVARVMHHGLPGDQAVAYIIDAVDAKQNRNGIINTAKRLGEITDSSDMAIFKDAGNKCIAAVSDADKRTIDGMVKNLEKKRNLYTADQFEKLQSTFRSSLQSVNLVVKSVDISYAKKYRVIPIISTNNVKLSMVENTPRFKPLREALSEALSSLDIQNEYQIDLVDMGFDGYLYGIQFIGKRDQKSSSAKESIAKESAVFTDTDDATAVEKLLANTEPDLRRKLKTVEDCDAYLETIKNESTKFNEAANAIISAQSKYEHGDKTKEDTKEFNKTVDAGKKLLNDNCRKLKVKLGKLVGDNDHISRQDIKNFSQYISGLRKIVNNIKRELNTANESVFDYYEGDALESILAIDGIYEFEANEAAKSVVKARSIRTIPALIHAAFTLGKSIPLSAAILSEFAACGINGQTFLSVLLGYAGGFGMVWGSVLIAESLICLAITNPRILTQYISHLKKKRDKATKEKKQDKLDDKIKSLEYLRDNFQGYYHNTKLVEKVKNPKLYQKAIDTLNNAVAYSAEKSIAKNELKKMKHPKQTDTYDKKIREQKQYALDQAYDVGFDIDFEEDWS